jgi:hypothetical protein
LGGGGSGVDVPAVSDQDFEDFQGGFLIFAAFLGSMFIDRRKNVSAIKLFDIGTLLEEVLHHFDCAPRYRASKAIIEDVLHSVVGVWLCGEVEGLFYHGHIVLPGGLNAQSVRPS